MKKIISFLGVIIVFLITSFTVRAVSNYSIVINNTVSGTEYSVYKIFDYGVDTVTGKYVYVMNNSSAWWNIITENHENTDNFTANDLNFIYSGNGGWFVVEQGEDFGAEEFAQLLKENIPANAVHTDHIAESDTVTIPKNESGYYFVTTTLGALCSLNTTTPVAVIKEKNSTPTIEKKVSDAQDGEYSDNTNVSIGDTVFFKIRLYNLYLSEGEVKLVDTMSDGLTLNENSFEVSDENFEVDAENYDITVDDNDFSLTFTQEYIRTLDSDNIITVSYSAVLNENALIKSDERDNINKAHIEYDNKSSVEVFATVDTFGIDIVKTNETKTVISGAEFLLYDAAENGNVIPVVKVSENEYRTALDGESGVNIVAGKVRIKGFKAGTVYIEEVTAPGIYEKINGRVQVNITHDMFAETETTLYGEQYVRGGIQVINMINGFLLPAAGGQGIILISLAGLSIFALSLWLFIRKSNRYEKI